MAEAARMQAPQLTLRVGVLASSSAQRDTLVEFVRQLGHVMSDLANANAVLAVAGVELASDKPVVVLGENGSGAEGQLTTDASLAQIDAALRAVAAGLCVRPGAAPRFAAIDESEDPSPLSPRELEVLIALADGLSNKAIARRFEISQHTIKFHIESIFRKLGVATRAEAVAKGLRRGLVHL